MSPEDPRHGTQAGYRAHRKLGEDACAACKRGAAATEARNLYRRRKGHTGRANPIGCRRRLQALVALGYDWVHLGRHLNMTGTGVARLALESSYMHPATVTKIVAVYERLSMTLPPLDTPVRRNAASRARNRAAREGWPTPLAWDDDIDNPNVAPRGVGRDKWDESSIDDAVVLRVLSGERKPRKLTQAEAGEVVTRAIAAGYSTTKIEALYGLKVERYVRMGAA